MSNRPVLIIERCVCSVYDLLAKPVNRFGFGDEELRTFVGDVTNGVRFLRGKGYLHRDIKPGNILMKVDDYGKSLYVLTDFGATGTVVGADEPFQSIYGTPEYLAPELYERGVLRRPGPHDFTELADVHSLAVTIYHVATGVLPFVACKGPRHGETMMKILTETRPGDISGRERINGQIIRSKEFPDHVTCSTSLQAMLKPLLAAMFLRGDSKLPFANYFVWVDNMLSLVPIKAFHHEKCAIHTVYVSGDFRLNTIVDHIRDVTGVTEEKDQLLILRDSTSVHRVVTPEVRLKDFPRTLVEDYWFVYEVTDRPLPPAPAVPKVPLLPPLMADSLDMDMDAWHVSCYASICHMTHRRIETLVETTRLLRRSFMNLRNYQIASATVMRSPIDCMTDSMAIQGERCALAKRKKASMIRLRETVDSSVGDTGDLRREVDRVIELTDEALENERTVLSAFIQAQEYINVLCVTIRKQSFIPADKDRRVTEEDDYLTLIGNRMAPIEALVDTLADHKKLKKLDPYETTIHSDAMNSLHVLSVEVMVHYNDKCKELTGLYAEVADGTCLLKKHYERTKKADVNLQWAKNQMRLINGTLNEIDTLCISITAEAIRLQRLPTPSSHGGRIRRLPPTSTTTTTSPVSQSSSSGRLHDGYASQWTGGLYVGPVSYTTTTTGNSSAGDYRRDKRDDAPPLHSLSVLSRLTGNLIINPNLNTDDTEVDSEVLTAR